eukprot:510867-Amphidinium_carterae.2
MGSQSSFLLFNTVLFNASSKKQQRANLVSQYLKRFMLNTQSSCGMHRWGIVEGGKCVATH